MTRRLFVLFAALVLFVPAACGGDDDDTASDEETEETTSTEEEASTDEGEEGDEESEEESSGDGDDFSAALEQAGEATIKVTYEVTGENQDPQQFTIAQDPPKFALQAETGLLIDDGERFISCDASEGGQCIELPREGTEGMAESILGAFAAPFLAFQQAADSDALGYEVTGSEEIAGRDAICATIDASELPGSSETGSATSCVDEETGILLLFEGEGAGDTGRIEAIEVSEPTDEDFEPTSEPMSIGG